MPLEMGLPDAFGAASRQVAEPGRTFPWRRPAPARSFRFTLRSTSGRAGAGRVPLLGTSSAGTACSKQWDGGVANLDGAVLHHARRQGGWAVAEELRGVPLAVGPPPQPQRRAAERYSPRLDRLGQQLLPVGRALDQHFLDVQQLGVRRVRPVRQCSDREPGCPPRFAVRRGRGPSGRGTAGRCGSRRGGESLRPCGGRGRPRPPRRQPPPARRST